MFLLILLHHLLVLGLAAVIFGYDDQASREPQGNCVYKFDVWQPPDDMLLRMRNLEYTCANNTMTWQRQISDLQTRMLQEQLRMRNSTHNLERALLEQRLEDVQLEIKLKDMKLELVGMRSDVNDLRNTVTFSGEVVSEGNIDNQDHHADEDLEAMRHKLAGVQTNLGTIRNGVGDLRAEWLLIKREVSELTSTLTETGRGQVQVQADALNLKANLEALEATTARLNSDASDLNKRTGKLERALSDLRRGGSATDRVTDTEEGQGYLERQIGDLEFQNGELQKAVERLRSSHAELKEEMLAAVLGGGNVSRDALIAEWFRERPSPSNRKPYRDSEGNFPTDCQDVYSRGYDTSGQYQILPRGARQLDNVYCEMLNGSGWTVIQRRLDGTLSFARRWLEYKFGFGQMYGEFWLGTEQMHRLTSQRQSRLRIDLWDWEGTRKYAEYDYFKVDSEVDKYRIHVRGYKGDAGDSLSYHDDMAFSTEDSDNDLHMRNCAADNKGGWWFNSCFTSNLNGVHHTGWYSHGKDTFSDGIVWFTMKESEFYSLRQVEIKIQPAFV